jgi:hypothetical protein
MPSNARDFARWMREQAEQMPQRVYMPRFRAIAFKVLEVAAGNTPVNTGRLRNGWHVTVGAPSGQDKASGGDLDEVLRAAESEINNVEFGGSVWIQNNVPYARVYEDGLFKYPNPGPSKATHVPKSRRHLVFGEVLIRNGYSVSAPNGMLADAVQQVEAELSAGVDL